MQSTQLSLCDICKKELSLKEMLKYSCGHCFCFSCFPFILFDIMQKKGLCNGFFLPSFIHEFPCSICQQGKSQIKMPLEEINNHLNKFFNEKTLITFKICEFCGKKNADSYCLKCNRTFCKQCLDLDHEIYEKIEENDIITIDFKRHEDINQEIPEINSKKAKEFIQSLFETLKSCEEEILKNTEAEILQQNNFLDEILYEITFQLHRLKKLNLENSKKTITILKKQFSLIENSILSVLAQFNNYNLNKEQFHPEKLKNLWQLLSQSKKKIMTKDFKVILDYCNNKPLERMQKILIDILKVPRENYWKGRFVLEELNIYDDETYFLKNPIKLLEKEAVLVEKSSFDFGWIKSNVSTTFNIKDESFIVWPGRKTVKGFFPLHIYNLTLMKKEFLLQESRSLYTVVATYPKYSCYEEKRWLYVCNNEGFLKVYEINSFKNFHEIYSINTFSKQHISSAIIFEDKFQEIEEEKFTNTEVQSNIYAFICLNDEMKSIKLYRFLKKTTEIVREIRNPVKNSCYSVNFYYDEDSKKTKLFFGFSKSYVKLYDIKGDLWPRLEFPTQNDVNSINFTYREKKDYKILIMFLIFTQNNNQISFVNMEDGFSLKTLVLRNILFVPDLVDWGPPENKFLIIPTQCQNCIIVMSFNNFEVVFSRKLSFIPPVNILKVLKKQKNTNEIKECLISFEGEGSYNQIMLYE